jgi:hypothetical protein
MMKATRLSSVAEESVTEESVTEEFQSPKSSVTKEFSHQRVTEEFAVPVTGRRSDHAESG